MAYIISMINQKGGVGKTTTAINLSAALALAGKKVLLVDIDPQANATTGVGIDCYEREHGIYDAIIGDKETSDIVCKTDVKNLHLAPSSISLAGATIELVNMEEREFRLSQAIKQVSADYDFVIIDNPPSLGLLTLNGLVASDSVLIPVQSEYYALEGLGQLMNTVKLVQENINSDLTILGVIITMFDKRNNLSAEILEELYKHFPYKIYRSIIPRNIRLTEAPSHGKSIFHYAENSRGARAYERLAKEFLAEFEEKQTQ